MSADCFWCRVVLSIIINLVVRLPFSACFYVSYFFKVNIGDILVLNLVFLIFRFIRLRNGMRFIKSQTFDPMLRG